jgi:hypothetical protein
MSSTVSWSSSQQRYALIVAVCVHIADKCRARSGLTTSTSRQSLTSFQEWSSFSAKQSRMVHTYLCSSHTSTSFVGDSTLQMTPLARVERLSSWLTNSCWIRWASIQMPASFGSTTSNCRRALPAHLAVQIGRTCRRWIHYASCTSVQFRFLLEQLWRFGVTTIVLRWASTRSR